MIKTINKNEKASLSEETNLKTSQNEEFNLPNISVGSFFFSKLSKLEMKEKTLCIYKELLR